MIKAVINHPKAAELDLGRKLGLLNSGGAPRAVELIEFRTSPPKSAIGKVLRKILREEETTKKGNST